MVFPGDQLDKSLKWKILNKVKQKITKAVNLGQFCKYNIDASSMLKYDCAPQNKLHCQCSSKKLQVLTFNQVKIGAPMRLAQVILWHSVFVGVSLNPISG